MKSFYSIATGLILTVLAAGSCAKESRETQYAAQETRIESFVNSQLSANPDAYVVHQDGTERLVLVEGSGDALESGGTVSFYWAGYIMNGSSLNSSNLFGTNSKDIAENAGWDTSDEEAFRIETLTLGSDALVTGLENGLYGVKGGQECILLFSGKYGFGKRPLGTIPANSALAYHIWVESLSND